MIRTVGGQYYKPAGFTNNPDADDVPVPTPAARPAPVAAAPKVETAPWDDDESTASAPVVTEAPKSNQRAEDILAMIRNRKNS